MNHYTITIGSFSEYNYFMIEQNAGCAQKLPKYLTKHWY